MGKILVIGAGALLGDAVIAAIGDENCIRASRSSAEKVDISDPKSIAALFDASAPWMASSAPAGWRGSSRGAN